MENIEKEKKRTYVIGIKCEFYNCENEKMRVK